MWGVLEPLVCIRGTWLLLILLFAHNKMWSVFICGNKVPGTTRNPSSHLVSQVIEFRARISGRKRGGMLLKRKKDFAQPSPFPFYHLHTKSLPPTFLSHVFNSADYYFRCESISLTKLFPHSFPYIMLYSLPTSVLRTQHSSASAVIIGFALKFYSNFPMTLHVRRRRFG